MAQTNVQVFSGNVGVGTSPDAKLHIKTGTTLSSSIESLRSNAAIRISAAGDNNDCMTFGLFDAVNGTGNNPTGYIQNSWDSESDIGRPLVLNPRGGNVGIGTTDPDNKLHVETPTGTNTNLVKIASSMNDGSSQSVSGIEFATNPAFFNGDDAQRTPAQITSGFYDGGASDWGDAYISLRTPTDPSTGTINDVLTIRGGNVGIGKTNPGAKLDVLGTIRVTTGTNDANGGEFSIDTNVGHIRRKVAGNGVSLTSYDDFQFYVNATGGSAEGGTQAMIIDNSGNVGIGTNNPLCPLDVHLAVAGDVDVEDAFDGYILTWTGVSQFDNYMTHNVAITADNNSAAIVAHNFLAGYSINFLSDRRIKKDIKEIDDESALEKFRLLKPSKYKYIEPLLSGRTDKEVYGYIAQEVAEVLPEGVTICDSNENTNQGHIPNIMSMCHIESQSISSDAYDILDAEQKSEYIETGNTYTRRVVTITETIDLDTFSVIDSTPRYKTSKQTKTTGAFDKRSDGEYHPLIFYSKNLQTIRANIVRVIDDSSFVVDKNLLDVHKFKNDKLLLYGQKPNDFHRLNKDVIFTLATAALQEVDRQLQAEKTKVTTLETQLASVLTRLDALESA